MSTFGGFGGGFGSSANNQQQSQQSGGFGSGGFGSTGTTGGFGSTPSTGFGSTANNAGGSLFGNTGTTGGGFGSGAFGSSTGTSPFGQNKTGFGSTPASSSGNLFGSGTATTGTGFGGFGGGTTSSTPAFGGGSTTGSGGLFGAQKTGFGSAQATGTTGGGLFGSGGSTSFGGGATTSTPAFGAGASTSFGSTPAQNNGTGNTPFSEHIEKDPASANTQNRYQTISTMQPYQGFSLEELRLADYAQGRKQGNQNGQAGAFGTSTGFGNFGGSGTTGTTGFGSGGTSSGGGMFGSGGTTSGSLFGGQQQGTSTGFGGGASGGGLFGAKPAATGGGLFGNTPATSGQTGGGLFGTSAPAFGGGASGGFGSGASSGTTLLGSGTTPAKPAFGGFGSGGTSSTPGFGTSSGTSFGTGAANPDGGSNFFGSSAAAPATGFGTQQQPSSTPFSFGQQGQQTQQQGQTGGGLFGGGFGTQNQQQKPGGLFGSTGTATTGGGLFGQQPAQQQQTTGGGLFGSGNQQQQGGGLFGNKPATSGLFGSTTTGNTGGGLFGSTQQPQQAQGGGLFGQTNQQNQSGGLFGNKPATGTGLGSSLFNQPSSQQQQAGSSLFGNSQQQQQPLGGSLFGTSQSQQQQPQTLQASLADNPYGNDQLFASLATPAQSPGPLATPLSLGQKTRKQALIPSYRVSPNASTRLLTPQRRPQTYGFSYSTYGTPGSAIQGSPYNNSLLGGGLGRTTLNKSLSTSNLRHSFSAQDSILMPGAFATTARSGGSNLKKLSINKNLNTRKPLFGNEAQDLGSGSGIKKSVSFDAGIPQSRKINGASTSQSEPKSSDEMALVPREGSVSPPSASGRASGDRVQLPQMQQVNGIGRGNELAKIDENSEPAIPPRGAVKYGDLVDQNDKEPGEYWSRPSLDEIRRMDKNQRENIGQFVVGRDGCGQVTFSSADVSGMSIDDIFGKVVVLGTRDCTVYGDRSTVAKPPPGKGLNVPSEIMLENCWPRSNAGALPVFEKKGVRYEKHIKRLKKVAGTKFVAYDQENGTWKFAVQHYTTYRLDYDDDDDDSMLDSTTLSAVPATPTPSKHSNQRMAHLSPPLHSDSSLPSPPESSPDDTFDFKKGKRKILPGQFDEEDMYDEDMSDEQEDAMEDDTQSFLDERSVGSLGEDGEEAMSQASESGSVEGQEMAGSFPTPTRTTEQSLANLPEQDEQQMPKSILKASQPANPFGTPLKTGRLIFGADWTEQLQRTASPKKQDRQALRANQPTAYTRDQDATPKALPRDKPFANSMDIMHSLFGQSTRKNAAVPAKFGASSRGFANPSSKRHRSNDDAAHDEAFHKSTKPRWGPNGTLVYTTTPIAPRLSNGVVQNFGASIVGEHTDVRFAKLSASQDLLTAAMVDQRDSWTTVEVEKDAPKDVPRALTTSGFKFGEFASGVSRDAPTKDHEHRAWELLGILFDELPEPRIAKKLNLEEYNLRLRKDMLSNFWKKLVRTDAEAKASRSNSPEESALHLLSGGMVEEACLKLVEGRNFHLATLVAQIGGDKTFREAISKQLASWQELNVLSEFNDYIRTIYELLAGNTCLCKGSTVAGVENKFSEFTISTRFGLDWRQSFGLRLWYGIETADDISAAVQLFADDLSTGREKVKPLPWFVEKDHDMGWTDPNPSSREDLLWSSLKIYSGLLTDGLESAIAPESVSGNPMNARFSFQLVNLFRATELGNFNSSSPAADALATTYAACLASNIHIDSALLPHACWVLLHLSDPQERVQSIRAMLNQHATLLDIKMFENITDLRIPAKWMHLSKALYARAVTHDPIAEAHSLIDADQWLQAHEVVCHVIGPQAVIEQDFDQLREIFGKLETGKEANKTAWNKGAGMYYDYINMKDLERLRTREWSGLVTRLGKALTGVMSEGLQGRELMERAALQMMGAAIAKATSTSDFADKANGLRLPLTEDAYLKHSKAMSLDYFKAILAA